MSYCVLFCVLYRKESANKRYRNTVNNLISPNTVSQNDEKPHTAELDDTAIPRVKIKIIEIPHEKKPNTAIIKPDWFRTMCNASDYKTVLGLF